MYTQSGPLLTSCTSSAGSSKVWLGLDKHSLLEDNVECAGNACGIRWLNTEPEVVFEITDAGKMHMFAKRGKQSTVHIDTNWAGKLSIRYGSTAASLICEYRCQPVPAPPTS